MKQNNQPGIHLHKTKASKIYSDLKKPEWYWILVAKNGKTIARSSETYKRKRSAVASIRVAAKIFRASFGMFGGHYFDQTGKNGSNVDAYNF